MRITIGQYFASGTFLRLPADISTKIHSHTLNEAVMWRSEKEPCFDLFLDGEFRELPQQVLLLFLPRHSIGIHA